MSYLVIKLPDLWSSWGNLKRFFGFVCLSVCLCLSFCLSVPVFHQELGIIAI